MEHQHDHIRHDDESFKYRGTLPQSLVDRFRDDKDQYRTLNLQGFIACGKTRTSKKFARLLAQKLRDQDGGPSEVHSFLFDLRKKSKESLLQSIQREFRDKIPRWKSYGDLRNVDELSKAFDKDKDTVYIIVLDNVDRVADKGLPDILEFVERLVSCTDNVYLVLTSRMKAILLRIRTKVMDECMKPMNPEDAKALLKETSGDPQGLDASADDIINLVYRSPLALIIAGHEMNNRYTMLAYTPREFVGVMKDSTSLSIDLENVPTEDRLINRVAEIVETNYPVLEKIVVALDCPQLFNTEELEHAVAAINGPPGYEGQIKQTILHVVLRRSLYGMNEETNGEVSLESAPFLIEVLKETFCQMTSKDRFLKDVNKNLVKTLGDTRPMMRSIAKELREAEIHLLRNQKRSEVTSQEKQELRKNVIRKACKFLDKIETDAASFRDCCSEILNELERVECRKELRMGHGGVQETLRDQSKQPTACSGSHQSVSPQGKEKEPEACLSPTFPSDIALPVFKEINEINATAKTPAKNAVNLDAGDSDESAKVDATNPLTGSNAEVEPGGSEKKITVKENLSTSTSNATCQVQPVIPGLTQNVEMAVTKESSRSDVDVNRDVNTAAVSQSPLNNCPNTVPSNPIDDESNMLPHLQSLSISEPGSLHSNDCRNPNGESLPPGATYSALPTLPDNHILTDTSNPASRRGEDGQHVDECNAPSEIPRKEPVESEFDFEHGEGNEVVESAEAAIADREPCGVATQAEGDEDHPGDKRKDEVHVSRPNQLPQISTTITVTSTMETRNHSEADRHPQLQQSCPIVERSDTRGPGILGTAPSPSSSSASPAYSQSRFPLYNNPVLHQNISSTSAADRRLPSHRGYGNLQAQEHPQMIPSNHPQTPYGDWRPHHDQAHNGHSFASNRFEQEYNQFHFPPSINRSPSNNFQHQDFTNNSHRNLQARGPPLQSYVSPPSPSFQAQGPSSGFPQVQKQSLQSQMPSSSSGFRAQASSKRFSHAQGPPFPSNDLSPSSSFQPHGPPFWSPPHSLMTNGYYPPPVYSNGSSPSPSFRAQGPPVQSSPHSLRTSGYDPSSGYHNGAHHRSSQRDYGQQSASYHHEGRYQQQTGYPPQRNGHY